MPVNKSSKRIQSVQFGSNSKRLEDFSSEATGEVLKTWSLGVITVEDTNLV